MFEISCLDEKQDRVETMSYVWNIMFRWEAGQSWDSVLWSLDLMPEILCLDKKQDRVETMSPEVDLTSEILCLDEKLDRVETMSPEARAISKEFGEYLNIR